MSLPVERRTPIVQERVDKVIELIAQGFKRRQIHEWIKNNTDWRISKATIDTLIKKAKTDISRLAKLSDFDYLNDAILSYKLLYKKALDSGDLKTALSIVNSLSTLLNLSDASKRRFAKHEKQISPDFLIDG